MTPLDIINTYVLGSFSLLQKRCAYAIFNLKPPTPSQCREICKRELKKYREYFILHYAMSLNPLLIFHYR